MADYDLFGNIAIMKSENKSKKEKLKQAKNLLNRPGILTVLEKTTNVSGRLRTIRTRHLSGEKNLIAELKENGCRFKLNVETCYFSPRLSNERQLISKKINMDDRVLVMFAGVGAYPIVIYRYSKPAKIVGVEIGRECCKYFKQNLQLNKIPEEKIKIIQGNVKNKVNEKLGFFDVVIMARPNLKETFLKYALMVSKKNTRLFYYGFCNVDEINSMIEKLKIEALQYERVLELKEIVPAGDIAPYKNRYRIEFEVKNEILFS
jgi:tRNA (guanine37-N1)-methyltransferase